MTDYTKLIMALRKSADLMKNVRQTLYMDWDERQLREAADAIEELQRINSAMKPKYDIVCVKCAYYAEAKHNKKGFLICPASGMDITAWDFCSYFEPQPPKEETE